MTNAAFWPKSFISIGGVKGKAYSQLSKLLLRKTGMLTGVQVSLLCVGFLAL